MTHVPGQMDFDGNEVGGQVVEAEVDEVSPALAERLDTARQVNAALVQELSQYNAVPPPIFQLKMRVDALVELVLASAPADVKAMFEIAYEENLGNLFGAVLAEARKPKIETAQAVPQGLRLVKP